MAYGFRQQLEIGRLGEERLDKLFSKSYTIKKATLKEEKEGYDRFFTSASGQKRTFEYKTDMQTAKTKNVFLETVSVKNEAGTKPGWLLTSKADVFVYYAYGTGKAYWFDIKRVRDDLETLQANYRTVTVPNKGYTSAGILISLADFVDKYVDHIITVDETVEEEVVAPKKVYKFVPVF